MLRRFPWSGRLIQRLVRIVQPRFTVGVVGVLLDDRRERVLLVEHLYHTRLPWGLPGGWIARREDPMQTVQREFYEETSLRVRVVRPLLFQRSPDMRGHMDVVYECMLEDTSQVIRLNGELLSYRWTPCADLPPLVRLHRQAISAALE